MIKTLYTAAKQKIATSTYWIGDAADTIQKAWIVSVTPVLKATGDLVDMAQSKASAVAPYGATVIGSVVAWSDAVSGVVQVLILLTIAGYWIYKALNERKKYKAK